MAIEEGREPAACSEADFKIFCHELQRLDHELAPYWGELAILTYTKVWMAETIPFEIP